MSPEYTEFQAREEIAQHEARMQKARVLFEQEFPGSTFRTTRLDALPKDVRDLMDRVGLVPLREGDEDASRLEHMYALEHSESDATYIALLKAAFGHKAFLVDTRKHEVAGYGKVAFMEGRKKSVVDMTETYNEKESASGMNFRGQGLAIRRLKTMNGISQGFYGIPLSSEGLFISTGEGARRSWERLVTEGRAVADRSDKGRVIYSFLPMETGR